MQCRYLGTKKCCYCPETFPGRQSKLLVKETAVGDTGAKHSHELIAVPLT